MQSQFEVREIDPVRVAYMKYRGLEAEANKAFPNVFKSVRGKVNGAPFSVIWPWTRKRNRGIWNCVCQPKNKTLQEVRGNNLCMLLKRKI